MRVTSSVTSVSWIPSEAITGTMKLPFAIGVTHWDPPLPDVIEDLHALREADRFRFANELRAWIDVDDGRITDAGYSGGGHVGVTTIRLGGLSRTVDAIAYPELQHDPEHDGDRVRFIQTVGGRTGALMPRKVNRPPYVQITAPTVWTTLALTLHADGTAEHKVAGASPFPRHWIYDDDGRLVAKSGFADFASWSGDNFGERSPWGDHDQQAIIADVESALERQLSTIIMRGGAKPQIRKVSKGATLTEQGEPGDELYLVLDGMLIVEVDGDPVAEVGPGAILGERAVLEGGNRTSTLRADTACKVAVATAEQLDRDALVELSQGHRREEQPVADQATR
ncbi:hypothetical protein BH23ACT10_BH23ACT10_16440 [soil metagenome]